MGGTWCPCPGALALVLMGGTWYPCPGAVALARSAMKSSTEFALPMIEKKMSPTCCCVWIYEYWT